ncbi:MAG: hypothetical protein AAF560_08520 [Acidobacteriota bacterium]
MQPTSRLQTRKPQTRSLQTRRLQRPPTRRGFLGGILGGFLGSIPLGLLPGLAAGCGRRDPLPARPRDAPLTAPPHDTLAPWVATLPWDRVVDVTQVPGSSWVQRCEAAQDLLNGRGVIYLPPGRYPLDRPLPLRDGVVLRGAPTTPAQAAADERPTVLAFEPGSAEQPDANRITLRDPASDSRCGVIDIAVEHGRIDLGGGSWKRTGSQRLVIGCRLVACARLVTLPSRVFVDRRTAAITVDSDRDALVQGNVLARSAEHPLGVDLDNRPGIVVNRHSIGGSANSSFDGSPLTQPFAFRRGLVIADNTVWSTGRAAITFTGNGTVCRGNTVRFPPDFRRSTVDGSKPSSGSQSNAIRGVHAGGWSWRVEDNDFQIFSNLTLDDSTTNDGQALQHTDHANSEIRGAVIRGNRSNAPFELWRTGGIVDVQVSENVIHVVKRVKKQPTWAVRVVADRAGSRHPCRDVHIESNEVDGGLWIAGEPATGNRIAHNRSVRDTQSILNEAEADVRDNVGLKVGQRSELGMT